MTEPRWLSDEEQRAWRGYRRMRLLLDLQVNRELARDAGLSEADYDVLSSLSESAGGRRRAIELARQMLWSKSRLAHQTTRMETRGLIRRETGPRGGVDLVLTPAGRRAIERAAPGHVASVRRHFIDLLSADEIAMLADVAARVVDHVSQAAATDAEPSTPS